MGTENKHTEEMQGRTTIAVDYMLFARSKQFPSELHIAPQQSDVTKQNATK
jgi:hypothetical protein